MLFGKCLPAVMLVTIVSLTVAPADAALLLYEGFDYPTGQFVDGANGGSGWDSGWESIQDAAAPPTETIIASSLSSPNQLLASTGGALRVEGSGDRFHRQMAGLGLGADGTTVYMSFLARFLSTNTPNAAIELTRGDPGNLNIMSFGSDTNATPNFGLNDKDGGTESDIVVGAAGSAFAPDMDTHLWVLQFDFAAGPDTVSLTYDGVPQGSSTVANASFDALGAFFFSGTAGMEFDEIRIGTELSDVVIPEPASLGLLLVAGVTGLGRRSRR